MTCPECGSELQATAKLYLSCVDGEWDFGYPLDADGLEFYCINDHRVLPSITKVNEVVDFVNERIEGIGGGGA
jgi:hypothetical protein